MARERRVSHEDEFKEAPAWSEALDTQSPTPELGDDFEKREKKLVRKMDLQLLPILALLYIMSFLDRVNIGNARLYNLEPDLGLVGDDYQLCVSILFVTYVAFELPVNLFLKRMGPRNFIPLAATGWGLVSMCTGFVHNRGQLIALRLLLGLFEAGFFPGINFYLTFWYRRAELGVRIFYMFTASAVAGVSGGLLAYGIGYMEGVRGYSAWRWVFILEGIPTILLGVMSYFILANDPFTAEFLSDEDRELVRVRRELDRSTLGLDDDSGKVQWDQVIAACKDWKVIVLCIAQFGTTIMLYGYSVFLPTIIRSLGYSGIHAQLLTIPCYFTGAVVYCVVAFFSDKYSRRGIFAVAGCLTSCAGYAILLGTPQYGAGAQYTGTIIVAAGLYVAVGMGLTWMPNNLPSHYKRATGQGLNFTIANLAGIVSPFIYRTDGAPRYVLGHAITLGCVAYTAILYTIVSYLLKRENKKRDRGERGHVLDGKTEAEIAKLGDMHPSYRYIW
ncbi:high-affinity nicotinic acid transporter [Durotheca rogersii]|uniref:high-affinity nicotinic acid transporter n=1 Tax=Durotheca rogersii TaxID=419775 RepID=UPI00221F97BC|nr:high-affinity nicotinic acid transporter [Durotheca rogersii]KAI5865625.1 high-affinity nicotinic acid transporter [Durotheca rogersii]